MNQVVPPKNPAFNALHARAALDCAEYVYLDFPEARLRQAGLRLVRVFWGGNTEALIACNDDAYFLSGRGTSALADWRDDARYVKTDFHGGGRVHTGFYDHYMRIADQVVPFCAELKDMPIVVDGHSLGGYMMMGGVDVGAKAGYFWGIPRIGNEDFTKLVDSRFPVFRFEHPNDPVTFVPPRTTLIQAAWALACFRKPTLYDRAGEVILLDKGDLHLMRRYRKSTTPYLDALIAGKVD